MTAYGALARHYDALMSHVDYTVWAEMLVPHTRKGDIVLDAACGTGSLSRLLAQRGLEVIAVDASEAMLAEARQKSAAPLFLNQRLEALDLYGTVAAAVCGLDAMNYITSTDSFARALARIHLFLDPGGVFLFDVKTPECFAGMDGQSFVSRAENAFCVWESERDGTLIRHDVTLFEREGGLWRRFEERHTQRAYTTEYIGGAMRAAGFTDLDVSERPELRGRVFILGRKPHEIK
ncbi:MAG: methyltransferase domain-containing protein [Oscillospiraceae bacterium]|jgi:ubiquinone/menaquinone biosynthesis C-methylase UbiE|nr:methyltransferase domain-containing protein [Oscillospiraceae bacterium]